MKKLKIKAKWLKASLLASLIVMSAPTFAQTNGTMMQYFHWYNSASDNLWNKVSLEAQNLSDVGITALWLPPSYKGSGGTYDVGYSVYDLYDLGEFDQQGTVRTKYGTKDEYLAAITDAHTAGVQIYADVVLNHKIGADATESVTAVRVDWDNRNNEYGGDVNIDAWTVFDFTARNNTYSEFKWRWYHFDGTDYDANTRENTIFKFRGAGKSWDLKVASEKGNYDYLMGADIDMDHPDVVSELKNWGKWYADFTKVDGFRVDAVKHINAGFSKDWINAVRAHTSQQMFTVAEYWTYNLATLHNYLADSEYTMSLFDAPLHMNFHVASTSNGNYDMGSLMNGTLMQSNPAYAVTLVENHDTQALQSLESPVADWFKPLAYSFILLRNEGYPNVFYADYYGATYTDKGNDGKDYTINMQSHKATLDILMKARRDYAYGVQNSYLDHSDVVGFTREGDAEHWKGLAVLMTDNSYEGYKWMKAGDAHKNACFTDITGNYAAIDKVCTNNKGWGNFKTKPGSVSVWVKD